MPNTSTVTEHITEPVEGVALHLEALVVKHISTVLPSSFACGNMSSIAVSNVIVQRSTSCITVFLAIQ